MTVDTPKTAAQWIARFRGRSCPRDLQAAFESWLAENPQNRLDFTRARFMWDVSSRLDTSPLARNELRKLHAEAGTGPSTLRKWLTAPRYVPVLAGVAAAAFMVFSMWTPVPESGLPLLRNEGTAATAISEVKNFELPDGTVVALNADSTVRVGFTKDLRTVYLERGEAFFEVQKHTGRPFVVTAGGHSVTVTGTKFNVSFVPVGSSFEVAVAEGHVNVQGNKSSTDTSVEDSLSAGDVISLAEDRPTVRKKIATTAVASWRTGRLRFEHTSLRDVLTEVNRYSQKRLVLSDARLANLPLSGSFKAGDIDAVLFSLQQIYKINAKEAGDVWILSSIEDMR
jgi:transmembrane sensor